MPEPQTEQRATRRFALRLPLTVKLSPGDERQATTRDISARGVCFVIDTPMNEGAPIEFTLTLPPEITLTDSIRVRCKGRVVRVEPETTGRIGVAAIIERYEFLPEA